MIIDSFRLLTSAAVLAALSAPVSAQLLSETFDTNASISEWVGAPTWNGTAGNPGGAVIVSNNVQPTNKNYTVSIPLELTEASDITVEFHAKTLTNIAGVLHFYAEPEGFPQFFIKFNVEAMINGDTFTPLVFEVKDVPASASFLTLRFEMITGAVQGADVSVAIDNLIVTGPTIDPEGTWKGYDLVDGFWVDTGAFMGWVYVGFEPWYYSLALDNFFFVEDSESISASASGGAWMYLIK